MSRDVDCSRDGCWNQNRCMGLCTAAPMANGLTEAETSATASVTGLTEAAEFTREAFDRLGRENKILAAKNRASLANNLCPDHRDKQTFNPCLACTIETLIRERDAARAELADLCHLFNSRPAINAGLPQTYVEWTQKVYAADIHRAAMMPRKP